MVMCSSKTNGAHKLLTIMKLPPAARRRPAPQDPALGPHPRAPLQGPAGQPARAHGRNGPESPQREKNAQEAAAALGPRESEYRCEAGSAEPPDQ